MTAAIRACAVAFVLLVAAAGSGCAVHVHDDAGDRFDSCSVHCGSGGQAEVSCEKPKIPACSCEPEVAAACISARNGLTRAVL